MPTSDWAGWHDAYDWEGSRLSRRLAVVQNRIREALDCCPPGRIAVISMCAGQGRDLLGVLPTHPRRDDVAARLVELDPHNAKVARDLSATAGLRRIEVVVSDAARTDVYRDLAPAQVVLACGIFGNLPDADIRRAVSFLPALCERGGTVIWTRHRRDPDMVPTICEWLADADFDRLFVTDKDEGYGVGAHRYSGVPVALPPGERMFTF